MENRLSYRPVDRARVELCRKVIITKSEVQTNNLENKQKMLFLFSTDTHTHTHTSPNSGIVRQEVVSLIIFIYTKYIVNCEAPIHATHRNHKLDICVTVNIKHQLAHISHTYSKLHRFEHMCHQVDMSRGKFIEQVFIWQNFLVLSSKNSFRIVFGENLKKSFRSYYMCSTSIRKSFLIILDNLCCRLRYLVRCCSFYVSHRVCNAVCAFNTDFPVSVHKTHVKTCFQCFAWCTYRRCLSEKFFHQKY